MRAPSWVKVSGDLRNVTTSSSSCLASSTPTTSAKVTCVFSPCWDSPRCLVKAPIGLPRRLLRRSSMKRMTIRTSRPSRLGSSGARLPSSSTVTLTPSWRSWSVIAMDGSFWLQNRLPCRSTSSIRWPWTAALAIPPWSARLRTSLIGTGGWAQTEFSAVWAAIQAVPTTSRISSATPGMNTCRWRSTDQSGRRFRRGPWIDLMRRHRFLICSCLSRRPADRGTRSMICRSLSPAASRRDRR